MTIPSGFHPVAVAPECTNRVFVDFAAHNSKVYFVQGDVGTPGRLPITGKETVLDAINCAGGLIPTAEASDIHLYRPARGAQPAQGYRIDLGHIMRGDARANLQIFANDRLVVGRNAIVRKTIEIDRATAPVHTSINAVMTHTSAMRSIGAAADASNATSPAQGDETIKRWLEFLWRDPSSNAQGLTDLQQICDAILRKLDTRPEVRSPAKARD